MYANVAFPDVPVTIMARGCGAGALVTTASARGGGEGGGGGDDGPIGGETDGASRGGEAERGREKAYEPCTCSDDHPDPEGICTNVRFTCWVSHLYKACVGSEGNVDAGLVDGSTRPLKQVKEVYIQRNYFQNRFIFARRRFDPPT